MGCYGYICKECGTSIRGNCYSGGENCVLIHVRHGKILGQVEGHYNEYGGVMEDEVFDKESDSINGHQGIMESTFNFSDSYQNVRNIRIINGKEMTLNKYINLKLMEDLKGVDFDIDKLPYLQRLDKYIKEANNYHSYDYEKVKSRCEDYKHSENAKEKALYQMYIHITLLSIITDLYYLLCDDNDFYFNTVFESYPKCELKAYSGVVAYHKVCYNKAKKAGRLSLVPSDDDPNQSWGKVRKKYS